jgi:hypothetical protein
VRGLQREDHEYRAQDEQRDPEEDESPFRLGISTADLEARELVGKRRARCCRRLAPGVGG